MPGQEGNSRTLFGGDLSWDDHDWAASDDRVRGGSSQSHLHCNARKAVFSGHLDTQTLGGAGFASQRTTQELQLDLSEYHGICLTLDSSNSDQKKYTFIIKDEILPRNPENGRDQSKISWEYDFEVPKASLNRSQATAVEVFIPWHSFKATYRGKERKGVHGPDLKSIKRLSIMMRSFFDAQQGDFKLTLLAIRASRSKRPQESNSLEVDASSTASLQSGKSAKGQSAVERPSVWSWLLGRCGRL